MIKEKKKNKLITFLCACLIALGSLFGLVGAFGDTLAYTPSKLTTVQATEYFTNYKDYNFNSVFDGYFKLSGYNVTDKNITVTFYDFNNSILNNIPAITNNGSNIGYYFSSNGAATDYSTHIINISSYNYLGNNLYFDIAVYMSSMLNNNVILSIYFNSNYYNFISYNFYNTYTVYNLGLADADTTSAYNNGYNTGYAEGQTNGYNTGYSEGQTNGITQGQNNILNNPNNYDLYTQAQYQQNYVNGQNSVINNPNAFGLYTQAQYLQNYTDGYNAGVTQGQNNVLNNPNDFGLNSNQQLEDSYNQGFADGEQSSDAYQNGYDIGYSDGYNEVLNNPNNYGLYTQVQYQQNYTDGYNAGVLNSQYGILSNVVISGLVDVNGSTYGVNNSDFDFNAGTITPNSSLLNKFNNIYNSSYDSVANAYIRFTLSEQFVYSSETLINFVNLSLLDNSTSYLMVTYETTSNTTVPLIYSYNAIYNDGVFAGYNIGVIGNEQELLNNTIKSFVLVYMFGNDATSGITFTRDNLVKPQALSIFSTSVLFDNGYNLGYIDGSSSTVVNNAYDRGVVDGFNSGYSQGLANQDNASFASMISAVIDVPINAMRNLFNFDLLGINLFGFFSALFTLLVVITIIRLILGGK